jgi:hypothetical protein
MDQYYIRIFYYLIALLFDVNLLAIHLFIWSRATKLCAAHTLLVGSDLACLCVMPLVR